MHRILYDATRCSVRNGEFLRKIGFFREETRDPEGATGVGAVTSLREMTLSNAKASVTRLSNTFRIFHRIRASARSRFVRHCILAWDKNRSKYFRGCSSAGEFARLRPSEGRGTRSIPIRSSEDRGPKGGESDGERRGLARIRVYAKLWREMKRVRATAREDQVRPRLRTVMGAWVIK